jgi:ABC-2 type transport system ATP-binding protein
VESGTLAEMRHLTRTSIAADLARPPVGLAQLAGVHDLDVQDFTGSSAAGQSGGGPGVRVRCQVESGKLDEVLRELAAAGVLSLVSQPPTLEELFLRHYAAPGAGTGTGQPRVPA